MKSINSSLIENDIEIINSQTVNETLPQTSQQLSAFEIIFGKTEVKTNITVIEEFKKYLNISVNLSSDPINWWKTNQNDFPRLAKLAKKYLSIPSTSVSSERIFSTAGNLITKKRTALKPELVNKLIFLKKNM